MNYGIIGGSGFYEFPGVSIVAERAIATRFGPVSLTEAYYAGNRVFYLSRHGKGHRSLSHQVNYRANLVALKDLDVDAVVATTVTGVADPDVPLGRPIVFDDLYFPENRLPNGEACTVFVDSGDPRRGHLIASSPFSASLRRATIRAIRESGLAFVDGGTYAQVNGPRFNTKAEIASLRAAGVLALSQTAGPEIVLSGELEIPYQLIGFGVDYANGTRPEPTQAATLDENLKRSSGDFTRILLRLIGNADPVGFDSAVVYRFE